MYIKAYLIKSNPHHASPEGEGTDWRMLKILAVLFDARQRGVTDGAATPTSDWSDSQDLEHERFVIKLLAKTVNTASHKGCSVLRFFPR